MSLLQDLYQDLIIDHTRSPRNFGVVENPTFQAEGHNPLCGDQIKVFLKVDENNVIQSVHFVGSGCSISTASASLMTEILKGKTLPEADALFFQFHMLLTQDSAVDMDALGKLAVFSGVKAYPSRVKCATLAWHTMQAALHGNAKTISTE